MSNKGKMIIAGFGVVISIALLVVSSVLVENAAIRPALATVLIAISVILTFAAISYAAKVDYETGVYKCRRCGNVFKPTFKAYFWGAHSLTTRQLKCPKCKEKSWCKRKAVR